MTTDDLAEAELLRPTARVHYRRSPSDSGGWIVFLHGAGADGHMFDPQLPAVPDHWGIACWDARGHGRSSLNGPFRYPDMVADLEALVAELGPTRLVLVGQSLGGNLAQTFAEAHPDVVEGLVLIDCTNNYGRLTRMERWALRSTTAVLTLYPWRLAVDQSARACGTRAATVGYMRERLLAIGKKRFIEVMGFWRDALEPGRTRRFCRPTLLVLGEQDRTGNIRSAMRARAAEDPSIRLVETADAAHNANMDQPDVVNRVMLDFLDGPGLSPPPRSSRPTGR